MKPRTRSPHLLRLFRLIRPVVFALNFLNDLLHLRALLLPHVLAHLQLLSEQLVVWLAVAAAKPIPQRSELAIIVVEIEMVHCVARSTIDNRRISDVLAVVDKDRPDIDEYEQEDVGEFLQGEEKREDVVGHALQVAVHWVEGVRGVRRRHDPLVVRLVEALVDERVVQAAVDPVDEEVGEGNEDGELQIVVPESGPLDGGVVHFGVATHFQREEGDREDGHYGQRDVGLSDLLTNLVFQILWMVEGSFVKDEDVGEGRADIVDHQAEEPWVKTLAS